MRSKAILFQMVYTIGSIDTACTLGWRHGVGGGGESYRLRIASLAGARALPAPSLSHKDRTRREPQEVAVSLLLT